VGVNGLNAGSIQVQGRQVSLTDVSVLFDNINRDDWIRTSGPFVPNEVRYQAAPHPASKITL
jgi:hypothetical protein